MKKDAYGKVNLTLEVYATRQDGYHGIRSIVQPVSLCDTLEIEESDAFSCDTGFKDDLCLKAARALDSERGVRIRVIKRIPVGGGMGGGSADAAVTLLALNEMRRLGKSPEELAEIGARVGSDVPALVLANHYRRPVWMEGRGEQVGLVEEDYRYPKWCSDFLVMANPGVNSCTKEVYGRCTTREIAAEEWVNDLEQAAFLLYPEIAELVERMRDQGLFGVMMSGSGATVFGFAENEAHGADIVGRLTSAGIRAWQAKRINMCTNRA